MKKYLEEMVIIGSIEGERHNLNDDAHILKAISPIGCDG